MKTHPFAFSRFAVCCLLSLGSPASPTTALEFPNTPVGTLAQAWLRLCRVPNLEGLTQWISANVDGVKDDAAIDLANENLNF
jgi:hypothetical protein